MKSEINNIIPKHWPELKRLALSITKAEDIADDVLQNSFLKALSSTHQAQQGKTLNWFKQIVRNAAIDALRFKKRQQQKSSAIDLELIKSPDNFDEQSCSCVTSLLQELPPKERNLLVQVDVNGLKYKELSNMFRL